MVLICRSCEDKFVDGSFTKDNFGNDCTKVSWFVCALCLHKLYPKKYQPVTATVRGDIALIRALNAANNLYTPTGQEPS